MYIDLLYSEAMCLSSISKLLPTKREYIRVWVQSVSYNNKIAVVIPFVD